MIKYINGADIMSALDKSMKIKSFNKFIDKLIECGFDQINNKNNILSDSNIVFKKDMVVKFINEYDITYTILIKFSTIPNTNIISSMSIEVSTGLEHSIDFISLAGYDISLDITCLKLMHQLDVYLAASKMTAIE